MISLLKGSALPQDEPHCPFIFTDLLNVLGARAQHNYSLHLRHTIYMEVNRASGSTADVRGIVFYQLF